ncbi:MAG TPA: GHMP kinase [Anaerolineales bacterium]|nr:GHMP kinase [Anaerolineales bacterium]
MIIARAPVRISFAGGGTDLPAYADQFGGAVVSTAIDKYVYVILNVHSGKDLQIGSSDYRTFFRHTGGEVLFWEGELNLPKAILHEFGIDQGVSMFLASEVPPGTGLGSSSTVTVASLKAISTACGLSLSKLELAEKACQIELKKLGMPIGYQDQFAAAFGGFNRFDFTPQGNQATPLNLKPETLQGLQKRLLLFFTGQARDSTSILARQSENTKKSNPQALEALHAVRNMVEPMQNCLQKGDLEQFGELLHEGWQHKKRFASGISNSRIDDIYSIARTAGVMGGKLAGAGGGGFIMLYCQDGRQEAVTQAMEAQGLRRMSYNFESGGARVLLNAGLRLQKETQL